jgi:hypothetical protein
MATRRTALLEFLKRQRMAVQASTSANGAPQAPVVAIVVGDGLELLFDTIRTSRKAENLRQNPRVAFVIGGWTPGDKRSVQYEGIAEELGGADLERLRRVYFGRISGEGGGAGDWPDLTYVRVRPTWIRFGDFNPTLPEIVEFSADELDTPSATSP